MNVLVIGGSGFIGPWLIKYLKKAGHHVTVFHRGTTATPEDVGQILGDHHQLRNYREQFQRENFDVVVDCILSSGRQARELLDVFRGITHRVVALSSMDVYRAVGVIHGTEAGPPQELPLREESELRTKRQTYSAEAMKHVKQVYPWVDDDYDKVPVEEAILSEKELAGTTVRLPMIYGPGDPLHRLHWLLKRMDDGRPFIILPDDMAAWRGVRGYVENVGAAIALVVSSEQAAGRSYNVCESDCPTELEHAKRLAAIVGWRGEFITLPKEKTPQHLRFPGNLAQHLVATSEKIRNELGYREPIGRDHAILQTVEWERRNHPAQPMFGPFKYEEEDKAAADLKRSA